MEKNDGHLVPAHPPEDYRGSVADWASALQARGLWNGKGWYGDVEIPVEDWWEILEECEGADGADDASLTWESLD